jgi:hypothetical protein
MHNAIVVPFSSEIQLLLNSASYKRSETNSTTRQLWTLSVPLHNEVASIFDYLNKSLPYSIVFII